MLDTGSAPPFGGVGEIKSKRIPGREDVPEEIKTDIQSEGITLEDLKLSLVLLDACAQRGAFKISEFSVVGKLVDKMEKFISSQENQ